MFSQSAPTSPFAPLIPQLIAVQSNLAQPPSCEPPLKRTALGMALLHSGEKMSSLFLDQKLIKSEVTGLYNIRMELLSSMEDMIYLCKF